jgi:hypothetical protein
MSLVLAGLGSGSLGLTCLPRGGEALPAETIGVL